MAEIKWINGRQEKNPLTAMKERAFLAGFEGKGCPCEGSNNALLRYVKQPHPRPSASWTSIPRAGGLRVEGIRGQLFVLGAGDPIPVDSREEGVELIAELRSSQAT